MLLSRVMKLHTKKLKNGLTIQIIEMPGTNVVTSLILVGAGSRYEDKKISGISHFLEHMFFKGGERYKTPKEVSSAIDSIGAEFNAFTGKEYVGYYVKSSKEFIDIGLDVLSDMMLNARFPKEEIEKERGVILEEMAMYQDLPIYQVSWDFERVLYGDQPLGRDQIGEKELINTVSQKDFFDYKQSLYVPENTVIILAGAVNDKDIDHIERYFTFNDLKKTREAEPFNSDITTEKFSIREKNTEQYHISFGVCGLKEKDDRYVTQKVLSTILGGNMSSRMFQNVREDKGLCYSIKTTSEGLTDVSSFVTRAGVKLDDVLKAVKAIGYEYDLVAENGITDEELENAKSFIKGKLDLGTEDTEEVAMYYATNKLFHNLEESFEELKERVSNVTKEEVNILAKELLQPERYRFAGIGPKIDEEKLLKLIS